MTDMQDEGPKEIDTARRERVFLQTLLRGTENDPTLQISDIEINPGCDAGDNYMSTVTRITLHGTKNNGQTKKCWSVITKRQPASESARKLLRTHVAFRNEVAAYSKVINGFKSVLGNTVDELKIPKCLYADDQLIVLQDLKVLGFVKPDRRKGLDFQHCKLVLQALAKFHSLSYAMNLFDILEFSRLTTCIEEVIYSNEAKEVFGPSVENSCRMAIGGLEFVKTERDAENIDKAINSLKGYKGKVFETLQDLVSPREPFSVISHGDLTVNNLLFKYKEDSDGQLQVEDVMLLDLQVMRHSSPAVDILHFLYTSTLQDLRERYYEDLLQIYYNTLQESLQTMLHESCYENQQSIIFTELKKEMKTHDVYGLLNSLWMMTAITADPSNVPDMDKVKLADFSSEEGLKYWIDSQTDSYRLRIKDLVLEYVKRGVL